MTLIKKELPSTTTKENGTYVELYKHLTTGEIVYNNAAGEPVRVSPAYKVYTALLTQTGTDAPVAIVQENTLGATITYQYLSDGIYGAISDIDLFTSYDENTSITGSYDIGGGAVNIFTAIDWANQVIIGTSLAGVFTNDLLNSSFVNNVFEIKIYN